MANHMMCFMLGLFLLICCYSDNVMAADSDPLQDFCVADEESKDYAVGGINPPHTHPRATEVLVLLEGELLVGFTDTNKKFFNKTLEKGDVFVFPKALVHFQQNVGHENAIAIAGLSSQFPEVQTIANSLFTTDPLLPNSVSRKAYRIT